MPLPLAPAAALAVKYGSVALAGYLLARRMQRGALDQRAEDALDRLPEGATALRSADLGATDRDQTNATFRFRRVIRLGADGPAFEIDAAALGRLRVRRT